MEGAKLGVTGGEGKETFDAMCREEKEKLTGKDFLLSSDSESSCH